MSFSWNKADVIPRANLAAWHQYEEGVSTDSSIVDYSGNGRHLACSPSDSPVIVPNLLSGQPGWYFDGTRDPLVWTGAVTIKHLFIVASFEDAAFSGIQGLFSNPTNLTGDVLISDAAGDIFDDLSLTVESIYRKSDVIFPSSGQEAPMSGQHALIEVMSEDGFAADGIMIGDQRGLGRLFKGWFFESIAYSEVLNETQRYFLHRYFPMRYHLWPRTESGFNVFPFPHNKTVASEREREAYISEPYEGPEKALVRGGFIRGFSLPYALRRQQEFEAAEAFHEQHYPLEPYVMRDHRFDPPRETVCRFTSPFREQGSEVTFRFNYAVDAMEVVDSAPTSDGLFDEDGEFLIDEDGEFLEDEL